MKTTTQFILVATASLLIGFSGGAYCVVRGIMALQVEQIHQTEAAETIKSAADPNSPESLAAKTVNEGREATPEEIGRMLANSTKYSLDDLVKMREAARKHK